MTSPTSPTSPTGAMHALLAAPPAIRISEIHYDNAGTDAGERIELSGPAAASIEGYTIVLYNGNGGATYTPTRTLHGTLPVTCGTRGVVFESYPVNGIQNGDPDGIALVDANGVLVEFLSYGGTFVGVGGVANGVTSTPITNVAGTAVKEASTTPVGHSLQRKGDGSWQAPAPNTFGACNDNDGTLPPEIGPVTSVTISPLNTTAALGGTRQFTVSAKDASNSDATSSTTFTWTSSDETVATVGSTGLATGLKAGLTTITVSSANGISAATQLTVAATPPPTGLTATRFSEIHYDNNGTDANEAIEIEGDAGTSLEGWSIVLYSGGSSKAAYNTVALSGTFALSCSGRGAIAFPIAGIQNGNLSDDEPDGFALVDADNTVVEFLSYEGSFTAIGGVADGLTSKDILVNESSSTTSAQSLQRRADGTWESPKASTFGAVNGCANPTPAGPTLSITANGPDSLVVGWQRRGFVTYRDANGTVVNPLPGPITWTSETPAIASVDALGYVTALAPGKAIIRGTVGTATNSYDIDVIAYEPVRAAYRNHVEFGVPTGADPANDVLLTKPAFITSYNPSRGGPNWVSWNINASTFGEADRCECFSGDLALPASQRIVDFDYVGGGYDRGHMVQSESRTSTHSENAASFLLTNILPQAANNNQGPWLGFENFLNDQARAPNNRQVYVVAGGEYASSPTTLKNEGKVAIPDYTWKVAIVMNNGAGLADVHSASDITVYAIRIPNLVSTAPAKNNIYQPFLTTIDDIEARTGYDFFAALPDDIERIVESNDRPPVAVIAGDASGVEGGVLSFDASGSTDPDVGDVLSYRWTFGTLGTSTDAKPTFAFSDNGTYTVTLVVTDTYGATAEQSKEVTISNAAPVITSFVAPAVPTSVGAQVTATVNFTDAGSADTHVATIAWGDGSTSMVNAGSSQATATHGYASTGFYTITVELRDDDGAMASTHSSVLVVYDAATPSSVTGGGWLAGASVARGKDKTHFTLQTGYAGGATPSGSVSLRSAIDDLSFESRSFDYMIVEGATATIHGVGALGDGTEVGFLIVARDGKVAGDRIDRVRIRIWNRASGAVVFDTQPGAGEQAAPETAVDGGNITLHK